MTTEEVKHDLEQRLEQLAIAGNSVAGTFDVTAVKEFKSNLKFLRLFCEFVRLQTNDDHKRLPSGSKYLYNLSGAMLESINKEQAADQFPERLMHDWKKNYSEHHIEKLKKVLLDNEMREIRPELYDNFYRYHTTRNEKSTSV